MGYQTTIKANIKKAFRIAGDIAKDVTLSQSTSSGFDFATNTATVSASVSKPIKGILVARKKNRDDAKAASQQDFLFQSSDFTNMSSYDTITELDGTVWKMVLPFRDDGFLVTVSVNSSAKGIV